jgi:hypothetical protein
MSTIGKMRMSDNTKLVQRWFDDYRSKRGDDKPVYEQFKDDLYTQFGPTVSYLERCTRAMYDNWKPAAKRNWLAAELAALPDSSPLVKYRRLEIDYEGSAKYLTQWSEHWCVFSEQNDYRMKDTLHVSCYRLYAVITLLLTRTSQRTNEIKTHGLWVSGPKGYGKTLLIEFASGIRERRKKIAGDAVGVGRFKCNNYQEVIIVDDIKADTFKMGNYYQTLNQLLDNTGTEVKVHSSSSFLINKYVLLSSNERIRALEDEQKQEDNKRDDDYMPGEQRETRKKDEHPLRRRVLEVNVQRPMNKAMVEQLVKINNDADYREEGDKLMWRWYYEASKAHRFEYGCKDARLMELQRMLDNHCAKEYNFDGKATTDSDEDPIVEQYNSNKQYYNTKL